VNGEYDAIRSFGAVRVTAPSEAAARELAEIAVKKNQRKGKEKK